MKYFYFIVILLIIGCSEPDRFVVKGRVLIDNINNEPAENILIKYDGRVYRDFEEITSRTLNGGVFSISRKGNTRLIDEKSSIYINKKLSIRNIPLDRNVDLGDIYLDYKKKFVITLKTNGEDFSGDTLFYANRYKVGPFFDNQILDTIEETFYLSEFAQLTYPFKISWRINRAFPIVSGQGIEIPVYDTKDFYEYNLNLY